MFHFLSSSHVVLHTNIRYACLEKKNAEWYQQWNNWKCTRVENLCFARLLFIMVIDKVLLMRCRWIGYVLLILWSVALWLKALFTLWKERICKRLKTHFVSFTKNIKIMKRNLGFVKMSKLIKNPFVSLIPFCFHSSTKTVLKITFFYFVTTNPRASFSAIVSAKLLCWWIF